jgi:phenylalanyl-tRNA synthetase beta subunit
VDREKLQRNLAGLLTAQGFFEIITNSLTKPAYSAKLGAERRGDDVEILNKLSEDLAVMRQSLLFSGLEVLAYNLNRRQKNLKVFEFGKVYYKQEGKYREQTRLALLVTGDLHAESWRSGGQPVQFHDLAQAVGQVLYRLNAGGVTSADAPSTLLAYGLTYRVKDREVAQLGLLKPDVTKLLDVKTPVFYADLDWDFLVKGYNPKVVYAEVSRFPRCGATCRWCSTAPCRSATLKPWPASRNASSSSRSTCSTCTRAPTSARQEVVLGQLHFAGRKPDADRRGDRPHDAAADAGLRKGTERRDPQVKGRL